MCGMICGFVCVPVSDCRRMYGDVFVSRLECLQEGNDQIRVQGLLYTCTQCPLVGLRRKHHMTGAKKKKAGSESRPIPNWSVATYRAKFPRWSLRGQERV